MIVSTKALFKHAYGKYAIGAYNINNAEQVMGLFRGNMASRAPFMTTTTWPRMTWISSQVPDTCAFLAQNPSGGAGLTGGVAARGGACGSS